jgi:ABC-type lipoprotein export system ATPase subunit
MSDALARTVHASRTYRVDGQMITALADASVEVGAAARIALTGPSGSGKTTLMHLLAGLDAPTTGTVEWPALGERDCLRPLRVSLAFQGPSLLPALDVAENVAFPLLLGGASPADAALAAAAMLERMGLSDLAAKLPDELSGGQAQRVGLARALVVRPALLLADEPTGQQDHVHAARLLDLVVDIADEQGTALVIATHDPVVADRMTQHWTIVDGVLTTEGTPAC